MENEYCDEKLASALQALVGKWKPFILAQLFRNGTMRFSELQKALPDITKKMLTAELRDLEYQDIVHREVYMEIPPKVEYSITEYGKTLHPLIQDLVAWGKIHAAHLNELHGEVRVADPIGRR